VVCIRVVVTDRHGTDRNDNIAPADFLRWDRAVVKDRSQGYIALHRNMEISSLGRRVAASP